MSAATPAAAGSLALYRRLWRWHFYAGLFVLPFVMVLALSGTVFLFKPQIERWEERAFQSAPAAAQSTASAQVEAALSGYPGSTLHSVRLPQQAGDPLLVHLALPDGMRDVFVSPAGEVLGSLDADWRIVEVARRIHGTLLMGERGSWLVELAACWSIVMVVTGLFLWWPRGRGAAGVVWPRRRMLLRDLHAVTGFWVSGLVLVLLLTGLPWTSVWGGAFGAVRDQMGWVKGAPQWNTSDPAPADAHAHHNHGAMQPGHEHEHGWSPQVLDALVARGVQEKLAHPAWLLPPGAALFGPPSSGWTLTSLVQNRPQGATLTFDADGALLTQERFAERHAIDRVIGYGLAWHEGALLGAFNQFIGVLTAAALVTMGASAFLMWRRRRPTGVLGAPPASARATPRLLIVVTLVFAVLLPLLAASLVLLWLLDLLLPRIAPGAARWLGIVPAASATR